MTQVPAIPSQPGPLSDGTAAFPSAPPRTGPVGELIIENVVYSCEPGYRPLFLDLRIPQSASGALPLIVWIHGGGWMQGSRRRLPPNLSQHRLHDRMLERGYALAAVDYRLAREAAFPGMVLDVLAAIRWLRAHSATFNLAPERLTVWGESAGAHIATMLAMCTKLADVPRSGEFLDQPEAPQSVVAWYGPSDFTAIPERRGPVELLQESSGWTRAELSPLTYVRKDLPPMLLAHGTDDEQVPVDQSRRLFAALREVGAPVDYLEVAGARHVWVNAPSADAVIDYSLAFVDRAQLGVEVAA